MGKLPKCAHQTGEFEELVEAIHTRMAVNGELDESSLIMNNHFGDIVGYSFTCHLCGKYWHYPAPNSRSLPKWLSALHYKTFKADER
jgi:hypothetical protein